MKIAFDVDDTLIIPRIVTGLPVDVPNYETIAIFKWFQKQGYEMVVWSGGGIHYAQMWAEKLGLAPCEILPKTATFDVGIAFDDCDVELAKVNIKVKRFKNNISRREWNEHKPNDTK